MRKRTLLRLSWSVAGLVLLAILIVISLSVGGHAIRPDDILWSFATALTGSEVSFEGKQLQVVVVQLRLPRILLGVAAGGSLAVAGVVLQAILRNPMVSPFTLGISSASAFGASLGILFHHGSGTRDASVVLLALAFGLGCALLVLLLATVRRTSPETIILVGIALTYLFSACTSVLQYFATQEQLAAIVRWNFGSLNEANWPQVLVSLSALGLVLPLLLWISPKLNALAFAGDESAQTLGIRVARLRTLACVLAVTVSALVVSFIGVVAFVGLVAPHIARLLIGSDHRFLLPFSVVLGGCLMLTADTLGRTLWNPLVIPVGILISFLGAPLFLYLILTQRRGM